MHNKFIIMSYPRFAGGKFISNVLSLSKHCCPQDRTMAEHLIAYPDDYSYRLNGVLKSLPPNKSDMIRWIQDYEFTEKNLYGTCIFNKWQQGQDWKPDALIDEVSASGMYMFLTAHGGDMSVRALLNVWPDSLIVKLINHVKFGTISQKLKSNDNVPIDHYAGNYCRSKYELLAGPDWPDWKTFESVGYDIRALPEYHLLIEEIQKFYNWHNVNNVFLFDIDSCIFDGNLFLNATKKLYEDLNFTDFNPELVEKFWKSYISLHLDSSGNL